MPYQHAYKNKDQETPTFVVEYSPQYPILFYARLHAVAQCSIRFIMSLFQPQATSSLKHLWGLPPIAGRPRPAAPAAIAIEGTTCGL